MDVASYVCLRLLEVECGFPPVYDQTLEVHFNELEDEHNFYKDKFIAYTQTCSFPIPKDFIQLDRYYISFLRGILSTQAGPGVNVSTAYTIFLATRHLVQYYKSQNKGDFAMAVCFWMRDFLKYCDIDWNINQPRTTYFYKRRARIALWNNVVFTALRWYRFTAFNQLFSLYYRLSPWT